MKKRKILHYSIFGNNERGHGGQKRTNQIVNLLEKEFTVQELLLDSILPRNPFKLVFYFIYGIKSVLSLKIKMTPSLLGLIKIGFYAYQCQFKINFDNISFIVVEEFQNFGAILNLFAKSKGIPIVGVAHNIDSLVPQFKSSFTNLSGLKYFEEEIYLLNHCSFIITISREENWLLRLNKITSIYLPFIPSKTVLGDLNQIKEKRALNNNKKNPLLLGTVKNIPTKLGMKKLIHDMEDIKVKCDVVGFGSESLLRDFENLSYVQIHGGVSNEKLESFLINCSSMLVYQPATTGVLTRVIECLLCDIPVYGNESALRSYHYLGGTFNLADFNKVDADQKKINLREYHSQIIESEKKVMALATELKRM